MESKCNGLSIRIDAPDGVASRKGTERTESFSVLYVSVLDFEQKEIELFAKKTLKF